MAYINPSFGVEHGITLGASLTDIVYDCIQQWTVQVLQFLWSWQGPGQHVPLLRLHQPEYIFGEDTHRMYVYSMKYVHIQLLCIHVFIVIYTYLYTYMYMSSHAITCSEEIWGQAVDGPLRCRCGSDIGLTLGFTAAIPFRVQYTTATKYCLPSFWSRGLPHLSWPWLSCFATPAPGGSWFTQCSGGPADRCPFGPCAGFAPFVAE